TEPTWEDLSREVTQIFNSITVKARPRKQIPMWRNWAGKNLWGQVTVLPSYLNWESKIRSKGILKVLGICCEVGTGVRVNSARASSVNVLQNGSDS
ncbi:9947_t:CDS:2, partial [Paraglomus occultum]